MTSFESLDDLNKAIDAAVQDEKAITEEHPHRPDVLMHLGNLLFERYEMAGSMSDLNRSIELAEAAVSRALDCDEDKPGYLHNLAHFFRHRFDCTADMVDLDQAIRATNMAVEGLPPHGSSRFINVHNLQIMLKMRLESTSTAMATAQAADMNDEDARGDEPSQAGLWYTLHCLAKRFRDISEIISEDRAIEITEAMWKVISSDPPSRAFILARLGDWLKARFSRTFFIRDIDHAVEASLTAAKVASNTHPERAGIIHVLVDCLLARFESTHSLGDLDLAIETLQTTMDSTDQNSLDRHFYLTQLLFFRGMRCSRAGSIDGLDECIKLANQAIENASQDLAAHADLLAELGNLWALRFEKTRAIDDIDLAITSSQEVVKIMPRDYPQSHVRFGELGKKLGLRFDENGSMGDIDEAIQATEKALASVPQGYPGRYRYLHNIGLFLGKRFEKTGSSEDITRAVDNLRQAKSAMQPNDPQSISILNSLGIWLGKKSDITGSSGDLDDGINILRDVVTSAPDHDYREMHLVNLGTLLGKKFEKNGSLDILNESIACLRKAVDARPALDPDRGQYLASLGAIAGKRFERTGSIEDVDLAIDVLEKATGSAPETYRLQASWSSNLAYWLGKRYERTGSMADLNRAITAATTAVNSTPKDTRVENRLNILGYWLAKRFQRTASEEDIELAIQHTESALNQHIESTSNSTSPRADSHHYFGNLANCYGIRFMLSRSLEDIERAVDLAKKAVAAVEPGHALRTHHISDLGNWLGARFEKTRSTTDLDLAIDNLELAAGSVPPDHPVKASFLASLVRFLDHRCQISNSTDDADRILSCYNEGWNYINAPPSIRIRLADGASKIHASRGNWHESSRILEEAVHLLPMLSPRSLQNTDKQYMLSSCSGLAARAAATALNAGKDVHHALSLLESGRDIINGLLMETREDISHIQKHHPALAAEFLRLRDELDSPMDMESPSSTSHAPSLETQATLRRKAEQAFQQVIAKIRALPELGRFLLPPNQDELRAAAAPGPIAVLNPSPYRCDAFLIQHQGVMLVKLPSLALQDISHHASRLQPNHPEVSGLGETLAWLWEKLAAPCLDALGYRDPVLDDRWPHMWWIATGLLGQFPIHAAGMSQVDTKETVLDRVISSYASSIKALLHGRRRRGHEVTSTSPGSAVLVAMEDTPNSTRLPYAAEEVKMLEKLCPSLGLIPSLPRPYTDDVLERMKTCRIFHFSGHGSSHVLHPSESCLLLQDWEKNPLTVARLHGIHIQDHRLFLGYLSACKTRANERVQLLDESIHLTSAFQLAGFRHVVGTLWVVSDKCSVDVAREFYGLMKREGAKDSSISRGLHFAIRRVRDQQRPSMGESRKALYGETAGGVDHAVRGRMRYAWVPYVHFGV